MRFQYTVIAMITMTKWVELQTTLTKNILNEEENKSCVWGNCQHQTMVA